MNFFIIFIKHLNNFNLFCDIYFQSAVGIELWSMSDNILFDNLLITDDIIVAQEYAAVTYDLKRKQIDLESVS